MSRVRVSLRFGVMKAFFLSFNMFRYEASVHFFNFALKRVKPSLLHLWESTLLNMGHSLRKLK